MKETIAVLFGGQSSEHVVSCMSAANVIDQIDQEKYDLLLLGITEEGRWLLTKSVDDIRSGAWRDGKVTAVLSPDASKKCVVVNVPIGENYASVRALFEEKCASVSSLSTGECVSVNAPLAEKCVPVNALSAEKCAPVNAPSGEDCGAERPAALCFEIPVDVVFPVLHGLYGEDGTVQGLLELARIPYVGCGVLASAVSMDKLYTKIIVDDLGIRQARYVPVMREELRDMEAAADKVEAKLDYPVFVKPSNAGSSRGVSKAKDRAALAAALTEAARHDRKILVEEAIVGREVECAVFGGGSRPVEASGVGEILAAAEFYDFDAKYYNSESRTVVDPVLPGGAAETVRENAIAIFEAVDGYGLARVDFFVTADGGVIFNEINTMPGFTAISMYPMLWEARGVSKSQLVEKLIAHAKERYAFGAVPAPADDAADAAPADNTAAAGRVPTDSTAAAGQASENENVGAGRAPAGGNASASPEKEALHG